MFIFLGWFTGSNINQVLNLVNKKTAKKPKNKEIDKNIFKNYCTATKK